MSSIMRDALVPLFGKPVRPQSDFKKILKTPEDFHAAMRELGKYVGKRVSVEYIGIFGGIIVSRGPLYKLDPFASVGIGRKGFGVTIPFIGSNPIREIRSEDGTVLYRNTKIHNRFRLKQFGDERRKYALALECFGPEIAGGPPESRPKIMEKPVVTKTKFLKELLGGGFITTRQFSNVVETPDHGERSMRLDGILYANEMYMGMHTANAADAERIVKEVVDLIENCGKPGKPKCEYDSRSLEVFSIFERQNHSGHGAYSTRVEFVATVVEKKGINPPCHLEVAEPPSPDVSCKEIDGSGLLLEGIV